MGRDEQMRKVKVGVIGCGSIAKYRHLPEYAAASNVDMIAVCDVVSERAQAMAQTYGAKAYSDYVDLLNNEEIEAVSICTPNIWHAPMTIAALEAGKHVLCEKPMATTLQEAEQMNARAEQCGKILMIGHNQRFVPSHQKAKEMIAGGKLGKIYSFRTSFGHSGPEGWSIDGKDSWFFKRDQAVIGAMGDLGVHKADVIRFVLGEEISEVAAFVETSAKQQTNVEDTAVCILRTESGIVGTLAASWSYVKEDNSTVIYGEKGVLRLEDDPLYSLMFHHIDGRTETFQLEQIQSNESGGQHDSRVIRTFIDSMINDTAPPITGIEGLKSLKVILAAMESHATKKIIRL